MYSLTKIGSWAEHHHPKWIDLLRIILGIFFIIKGLAFLENKAEVIDMIRFSQINMLAYTIAHYVILAYLIGGVAIAIGLITRLAILFELPAVIGTIIFIDLHKNLFSLNSEIWYSIMLLVLLFFFMIYGSGQYSLDNYLQRHKEA